MDLHIGLILLSEGNVNVRRFRLAAENALAYTTYYSHYLTNCGLFLGIGFI